MDVNKKLMTEKNDIHSRQREEGDGEDAEAGSNGLADPCLRDFVTVANGGDSHLWTERENT